MTTSPDKGQVDAAVEAANGLRTSMKELGDRIDTLRSTAARQRSLIRLLGLSLFVDMVLSIGFGWLAFRAENVAEEAHRASSAAQVTKLAQYETCISTNRVRATQIQLWEGVLGTVGANRLPEIPQLLDQVRTTFAPRECPLP